MIQKDKEENYFAYQTAMRMTGDSKSVEGESRGKGGVVIFLHGVRPAHSFFSQKNVTVFLGWRQRGRMGRVERSDALLRQADSPNSRGGPCCTVWKPSLSLLVSSTSYFGFLVQPAKFCGDSWADIKNINFDGYNESDPQLKHPKTCVW